MTIESTCQLPLKSASPLLLWWSPQTSVAVSSAIAACRSAAHDRPLRDG